jgi:hypothetical protein
MLWSLMAEKEPWSNYVHAWEIGNLVVSGKREEIPSEWPSEIADLIQRFVGIFWEGFFCCIDFIFHSQIQNLK